MHYFRL